MIETVKLGSTMEVKAFICETSLPRELVQNNLRELERIARKIRNIKRRSKLSQMKEEL